MPSTSISFLFIIFFVIILLLASSSRHHHFFCSALIKLKCNNHWVKNNVIENDVVEVTYTDGSNTPDSNCKSINITNWEVHGINFVGPVKALDFLHIENVTCRGGGRAFCIAFRQAVTQISGDVTMKNIVRRKQTAFGCSEKQGNVICTKWYQAPIFHFGRINNVAGDYIVDGGFWHFQGTIPILTISSGVGMQFVRLAAGMSDMAGNFIVRNVQVRFSLESFKSQGPTFGVFAADAPILTSSPLYGISVNNTLNGDIIFENITVLSGAAAISSSSMTTKFGDTRLLVTQFKGKVTHVRNIIVRNIVVDPVVMNTTTANGGNIFFATCYFPSRVEYFDSVQVTSVAVKSLVMNARLNIKASQLEFGSAGVGHGKSIRVENVFAHIALAVQRDNADEAAAGDRGFILIITQHHRGTVTDVGQLIVKGVTQTFENINTKGAGAIGVHFLYQQGNKEGNKNVQQIAIRDSRIAGAKVWSGGEAFGGGGSIRLKGLYVKGTTEQLGEIIIDNTSIRVTNVARSLGDSVLAALASFSVSSAVSQLTTKTVAISKAVTIKNCKLHIENTTARRNFTMYMFDTVCDDLQSGAGDGLASIFASVASFSASGNAISVGVAPAVVVAADSTRSWPRNCDDGDDVNGTRRALGIARIRYSANPSELSLYPTADSFVIQDNTITVQQNIDVGSGGGGGAAGCQQQDGQQEEGLLQVAALWIQSATDGQAVFGTEAKKISSITANRNQVNIARATAVVVVGENNRSIAGVSIVRLESAAQGTITMNENTAQISSVFATTSKSTSTGTSTEAQQGSNSRNITIHILQISGGCFYSSPPQLEVASNKIGPSPPCETTNCAIVAFVAKTDKNQKNLLCSLNATLRANVLGVSSSLVSCAHAECIKKDSGTVFQLRRNDLKLLPAEVSAGGGGKNNNNNSRIFTFSSSSSSNRNDDDVDFVAANGLQDSTWRIGNGNLWGRVETKSDLGGVETLSVLDVFVRNYNDTAIIIFEPEESTTTTTTTTSTSTSTTTTTTMTSTTGTGGEGGGDNNNATTASASPTNETSLTDIPETTASNSSSSPSSSSSTPNSTKFPTTTSSPPPTAVLAAPASSSPVAGGEAASATMSGVSMAAGAGYAKVGRRLVDISSMATCGTSPASVESIAAVSFDSNPFFIAFGGPTDGVASVRGAVVGNVLFLLAWVLVLVVVAAVRMKFLVATTTNDDADDDAVENINQNNDTGSNNSNHVHDVSFRTSLQQCHFPGALAVPAAVVLPASASSVGTLAAFSFFAATSSSSSRDDNEIGGAVDIGIIIFGFVASLIVPIGFLIYCVIKLKREEASSADDDDDAEGGSNLQENISSSQQQDDNNNNSFSFLSRIFRYLFDPTREWKHSDFIEATKPAYEQFSEPIFAVIDFAAVAIIALVQGLQKGCGLSGACCSSTIAIAVAVCVCHVGCIVYFRPYLVRFDKFALPVISFGTLAICVLVLSTSALAQQQQDGKGSGGVHGTLMKVVEVLTNIIFYFSMTAAAVTMGVALIDLIRGGKFKACCAGPKQSSASSANKTRNRTHHHQQAQQQQQQQQEQQQQQRRSGNRSCSSSSNNKNNNKEKNNNKNNNKEKNKRREGLSLSTALLAADDEDLLLAARTRTRTTPTATAASASASATTGERSRRGGGGSGSGGNGSGRRRRAAPDAAAVVPDTEDSVELLAVVPTKQNKRAGRAASSSSSSSRPADLRSSTATTTATSSSKQRVQRDDDVHATSPPSSSKRSVERQHHREPKTAENPTAGVINVRDWSCTKNKTTTRAPPVNARQWNFDNKNNAEGDRYSPPHNHRHYDNNRSSNSNAEFSDAVNLLSRSSPASSSSPLSSRGRRGAASSSTPRDVSSSHRHQAPPPPQPPSYYYNSRCDNDHHRQRREEYRRRRDDDDDDDDDDDENTSRGNHNNSTSTSRRRPLPQQQGGSPSSRRYHSPSPHESRYRRL